MMKLITEKELKTLKDKDKVYVVYTHPDISQNYSGKAYIEQTREGCYFHIGNRNSTFCMDWTYGEEGRTDDSYCSSEGCDGDILEIYVKSNI